MRLWYGAHPLSVTRRPEHRRNRLDSREETMNRDPRDSDRRIWTAADIPLQSGRTAIVTGANSGIGLEAARALAARGAVVVMACRDLRRGQAAAAAIRATASAGELVVSELDLADLASVRRFASEYRSTRPGPDLLINNAGVMALPVRRTTVDGFEMQFATNHLGHFALTGLLIDRMARRAGARIVTVASNAHRFGRVDFADLQSERSYGAYRAYAQSKLANLLFAYELQRRLLESGACANSLAAHPGWTRTELQRHSRLARRLDPILGQPPAMGALPTLRAATDPEAKGGQYYGPASWFGIRGWPVVVSSSASSHDAAAAGELWRQSVELTGVDPAW
jgi:NAD(P)-dependent dehydrogenase (short-subunit alcohol dehydrogenase family)